MSHEIRKSQHERPQAEPQVSCAPAANASGSDTSPGAPPSNTAPANYNDGSTRIFRTGIDSLYLSWTGTLSQEFDELLSELREKARSPNPVEQSQAILQLLDHRFEVSDKGKGRFRYVLRDNWFHIQVSATQSTSMPLALVQIRSEVLSKSGYLQTVRKLEALLSHLGDITDQKISRIDICADFYTEFKLDSIPPDAWVRKAAKLDFHIDGSRFSGFSFGKRGVVSGRLYDKALEIESSQKTFFFSLWAEGGWLGELPVWRLEFQFRRSVLKEMGVNSTQDLDEKLNGLWQYCCQKWLRLTLPNHRDSARCRWPDHPLWVALKKANFGDGNLQPLYRTRKERLPSQEFLYVNGLGALTSFMASEGINSLDEAFRAYLDNARRYHSTRRASGNSLGTYINAKATLKARKFNTRLQKEFRDRDPETYRKTKEGE
jgi:hypothetical protein